MQLNTFRKQTYETHSTTHWLQVSYTTWTFSCLLDALVARVNVLDHVTYRACRDGSSGTGCSNAGRYRGAGASTRWYLAARGTCRCGWPQVVTGRRRDRPARTPCQQRPRPEPGRGTAADRPPGEARRPPPAAAAARVSGTSHAAAAVTSRAAVRATRHTHADDTTSLAACGHSTDAADGPSAPPHGALTRLCAITTQTKSPRNYTLFT